VSRIVSIGLVQIGTEPFEVERNRAATLENARIAFDRGAEIVVLPEMVIPGYVADARRLASIAEEIGRASCRERG
jgi:Carbon-nitrogen hydrolase.